MDRLAFATLHRALGKADNFSAIEVSAQGVSLTCQAGNITTGVTGGEFCVHIDGIEQPPWSVFELKEGSTLSVQAGEKGSWAYIGFCANINAPIWLESRATHLDSGLCGHPFRQGDVLTLDDAHVESTWHRPLSVPHFAAFNQVARVVKGPQIDAFAEASAEAICSEPFTITPHYNRMGIQLVGPALSINTSLALPSEALVRGTVQVTGNGDATVLMADHQTTGGYPKIATVISADIDQLAQARPGDALWFLEVTVEQAIAIRRAANVLIHTFLDQQQPP